MLSQMGQSMCSILEYQTLIDINVVTDDIDLPKRYIQLFFFFVKSKFFFLINCNLFQKEKQIMWIWSDPWIKVSLHHHVTKGIKVGPKNAIFFVKMISRKKIFT